jgi:prevent-host-death family protein
VPTRLALLAGGLAHPALLYILGLVVQLSRQAYVHEVTEDGISISDAREQLAAVVDRARSEHRPVYLSRRGHRVAAVIDADDLDRILELADDMADIRAAEAARAELAAAEAAPIPWEQVKADLGL